MPTKPAATTTRTKSVSPLSKSVASLVLSAKVPKSATAYDVPIASDELDRLDADLAKAAKLQGFTGKVGQTLVIPGSANEAMRVLVGIGKRDDLSSTSLRKSAAAFVRAVPNHSVVAITLAQAAADLDRGEAIRAVVEGVGLASYRYTALKGAKSNSSKSSKTKLRRIIVVASGPGTKPAFTKGTATVEAVALARDLVNEPGGSMTPVAFAASARKVCSQSGLKLSIWNEKRIAKERLGGVLAVNQGSTNPPRFLVIEYKPTAKPKAAVALVGKGITFDSGGLSIKTSAGMMTMKIDMSGGAAVLAAMSLLKVLGVKVAVTGYIPLTDNMINGDAWRPGDVFTARNGMTVEVLNTDAEGRLVLADALCLAAEAKPDAIIDIATLTGSVSAALGPNIVGIMGTSDETLERLEHASEVTDEKAWRLPLPTEYAKQLDSNVADLKNIGNGPYGGALVAGLFLKEFTDGRPWVHVDVGMSALSDSEDGVKTKGATGIGVRLLATMLENWVE